MELVPEADVLCAVFVEGKPIGQGNVRTNPSGRAYHANGRTLRPWRDSVGDAAGTDYQARHILRPGTPYGSRAAPYADAVAVAIAFYFPRPKSKEGQARAYPTVPPDGDHLERAIFDALTGTVLADDKYVAECHWSQHYARGESGTWTGPGVSVSVVKLHPPRVLTQGPDGVFSMTRPE